MTGLPFLFTLPVSDRGGKEVVRGQEKLNVPFLGLGQGGQRDIPFVRLRQGFAHFLAEGELESIGHGPADQYGVGLVQQTVNDLDFVRDFGPAEDDDKRPGGIFQFPAQDIAIRVP